MPDLAGPMGDAGTLYTAEAWGIWGETIRADPDVMFRPIRERFEAGAAVGAADYVAAWRRLEAVRRLWLEQIAGFDAVLAPTVPNLPPDAARLMAEDEYYVTENLLTLRNTRVGNLMGLAALTLPTDRPSCGLMLMAPPRDEARLLRLGAACEAAARGGAG